MQQPLAPALFLRMISGRGWAVGDAEKMTPVPGHDDAYLPGGREAACFEEFS